MKMFCTCGAVTNYDLNVPKFCSGCGGSFGGAAQPAKAVAAVRPAPKRVIQEQEPDEVEDDDEGDETGGEQTSFAHLTPKDIKITCEVDEDRRVPVGQMMAGVQETARPAAKALSATAKKQKIKQFLGSLVPKKQK